MSKSIYEEALYNTQILLALVDVRQLNAKKKLDMLSQIEQTLKQAQKQEELLKLYRELSKLKDDVIRLVFFETDYEHLRVKTVEIEQQIKELEKIKLL